MSESIFNNAIYLEDIPKDQWLNYIGKGYRSVTYMTDHNKDGQIVLLGFDLQGNRKTFICPQKSYIKYAVKYKTSEKDIFDNYVETKYFKNAYDRKKYIESAALNIVECLKPEQEFLHFLFDKYVLDEDFNKQELRIQSIDIETEISDQFMKPAVAGNRINMITIYDNFTDKYYTWSLEHAEIDFKEEPLNKMSKDKFVFWEFNNNESKLLEHFINWIEDNYPDVSYGWNVKAYDWPYIIRRIENVLGKEAAKRISPVGKYFIKEVNHDNKRADVSAEIEVNISGLFIADGLIFYRDKFMVTATLDGGYTLDNVGEHEGLGHKIKYDGSLKDLYLRDWQRFYEYNVRDVDLCKRINDKCQMIVLARQITSFGLSDYSAIYSSIGYLIGSLIAFARTQFNNKILKSYMAKKQEFPSFEGAYVFPTIQGIYRGGIGTIDFASLYPSNIRSINASPETYVGKVIVYRKDATGHISTNRIVNEYSDTEVRYNPFNDKLSEIKENDLTDSWINAGDPDIVKIEIKQPNGKTTPITNDQLKKLIETKCIYTANNTLFLKHEIKWGVVTKWCEHFYSMRKATKKKELKIFHDLHNPKLKFTEEEIKKMEADELNYHTTQIGFKLMINSIYGLLGTPYSPIANPDIAQSVTRQGRLCNRNASKFILKYFQEHYNASKDYVVVTSGDTDSFSRKTKINIVR